MIMHKLMVDVVILIVALLVVLAVMSDSDPRSLAPMEILASFTKHQTRGMPTEAFRAPAQLTQSTRPEGTVTVRTVQ